MTIANIAEDLSRYLEHLTQVQTALGQAEMAEHARCLQQFFGQTLWASLIQLELPDGQSRWSSATTELHRHMRLLMVEISFVQSARQGATRQQRLEQIEQRLEQLQGFTQVLLQLVPPVADESGLS